MATMGGKLRAGVEAREKEGRENLAIVPPDYHFRTTRAKLTSDCHAGLENIQKF